MIQEKCRRPAGPGRRRPAPRTCIEKTAPVNYADRGLAYESEEADRFIYTQQSPAERHATNPKLSTDPDLLAGTRAAHRAGSR